MANIFRLDIPGPVAEGLRSLPPDLKRPVRAALDKIAANPQCGVPLQGELERYWKYRVRRFRIVYAIVKKNKTIRIIAVAHRRDIYEEVAARMKNL